MPSTPYLVNGTTNDSFGNNTSDVEITFTTSQGSDIITSDSEGKYLIDLGNIGYTAGETVTYVAYDKHKNETYSGSFAITGSSKTLNISLSVRTNPANLPSNRATHIYNTGGNVVSTDNPFPVTVSKIPIGDGSLAITYDANNNPTVIVKTIKGDTYTRTITYDANNNPTAISEWVKS